nr:cobaltochelatase subunit CobT [Alphaproteobacteria bacterium]
MIKNQRTDSFLPSDDLKARKERWRLQQAAGYRALADTPAVDVRFSQEGSGNQAETVELADLGGDDLAADSAVALVALHDAMAIKRRYHDEGTHRQWRPQQGLEKSIYDALEEVRLEHIGGRFRIGVRQNLHRTVEATFASTPEGDAQANRANTKADIATALHGLVPAKDISALSESPDHHTLLSQGVRLAGRQLAFEGKPPPHTDKLLDLIPPSAQGVMQRLFHETDPHDQGQYAQAARAYAIELALLLLQSSQTDAAEAAATESADDVDGEDSDQAPADSGASAADNKQSQERLGQDGQGSSLEDGQEMNPDDLITNEDNQAGDDELLDLFLPPHRKGDATQSTAAYRAYTKDFDEEVIATDLASPEEARELRKQLDDRVAPFLPVVTRLANRLQRRLLAKQQLQWETDLEEGQLDPRQLLRLVHTPLNPKCFRKPYKHPYRDTVVTMLIDNSGSMRGRPIALAAMCAEVLSRTLEQCGVKSELLGFTTSAWKGGKSRDAWIAAGKKRHPGRLNDIRHICYKHAHETWRRARPRLGIMLREGLLKENIDGEALLWAHERLCKIPAERRILLVISDGAPVDDTTLSANGSLYLESHLHEVIKTIETKQRVELSAIGIGHAVDRYYASAVTI